MHPYATDSSERKSIPKLITVLSIIVALGFDRLQTHTAFNVPWWLDSPAVLGFYGMFYCIFNKWLWKYSIFHKIGLVKLPNLNGSWEGYGISSFDEHSEKYDATFTIKQNWNRISIIGKFEKSKSYSLTASIIVDDQPETTLSYEYRNEPFSSAAETMEIHRGFNSLTLNPNGQEMSGTYYSGRGRQNFGEIKLKKV